MCARVKEREREICVSNDSTILVGTGIFPKETLYSFEFPLTRFISFYSLNCGMIVCIFSVQAQQSVFYTSICICTVFWETFSTSLSYFGHASSFK